jgi:hypothetical protein
MARYFGVALRNGLAIGVGSIIALGKQASVPSPPPSTTWDVESSSNTSYICSTAVLSSDNTSYACVSTVKDSAGSEYSPI